MLPTAGGGKGVDRMGVLLAGRSEVRPASGKAHGDWYVEWLGSGAVVSERADPPYELWRLLATVSTYSADLLVLPSERICRRPTAGSVLTEVVQRAVAVGEGRRIWLAAPGFGRSADPDADRVASLARLAGAELVAPDGPVHILPTGVLYVAPAADATGWRVCGPGAGALVANRYPVPEWEATLPRAPVAVADLVAEPVPAGLLLREAQSAPVTTDDPAFRVPVDRWAPTLVVRHVGRPAVAPDTVAALFTQLPEGTPVRLALSCLMTGAPEPAWLDELAILLGADRSDTGQLGLVDTGQLGQAGKGRQGQSGPARIEPGLAPRRIAPCGAPGWLTEGWHRHGARVYQLGSRRAIHAEVGPAAIRLRPDGADSPDAVAVFDPVGQTITLGAAGLSVPPVVVTMLRRLLVGAPTGPDGGVRLRSAGHLDPDVLGLLSAVAEDANLPLDRSADERPLPPPVRPPPLAPSPIRQIPSRPGPRTGQMPARSLVAPVVTVADPAVDDPVDPVVRPARVPAATASVADLATAPVADLTTVPAPIPPAAPHLSPPPPHPHVAARSTPEAPVAPRRAEITPVLLGDRPSTPDERQRLATALGHRLTDALASVNMAMATWPMLRHDESASAKVDHVAVRIYLGDSDGGAVRLNAGLRAGHRPDLDGYLECLVGGLRRLPAHRRTVLCQGRLPGPVQRYYPVGALLTEYGFRSASMTIDIAVPDADVDLLVWSRNARQVNILDPGRTIDEAVFLAGTRFKVLAVHGPSAETVAGEGSVPDDPEVTVPQTAVLLREVSPNEHAEPGDLDDTDRRLLGRLERVLQQRRQRAPREILDADLVARLTTPLLGHADEPGAEPGAEPGGDRAGATDPGADRSEEL